MLAHRFACGLALRPIHQALCAARFMSAAANLDKHFEEAKARLNTLPEEPGNDVKLKIYSLFKQATTGPCSTSKPGILDMVGRAKWDAWNSLGKMSKDEAKQAYIDIVKQLAGSSTAAPGAAATSSEPPIRHNKEGKIYKIVLNRPTKKNAITGEMYDTIVQALNESAKSDSVLTVLTGTGDYYCSGNDLSNFTNVKPDQIPAMAQEANKRLFRFVSAFIDHPKPLVALVNGPAVGIAVTTLGLCDIVYSSDKATFHTPFTVLGQTAEGCSSYVFPRLMGSSKAAEVLLFGRKLSAKEACDRNLITEVFPASSFEQEAWTRVKQAAELPPQTMKLAKGLVRSNCKDELHKVNKIECDQLTERWQSEECRNAIVAFFTRKSKM